jgi:hypothetical protein
MVLLHTQETIKYFRVAPAAVWAFDYLLTLEHEVRLFSNVGRWNTATVMFIVARYLPIAWIVSEIYVTLGPQSLQMCLTTYRTAGVSLTLIVLASEGLLLMRTLALWHYNKKIKRLILAIYLVIAISIVTCLAIATTLLKNACVPASSQSDLDAATKLERVIMGEFASTAVFEFAVVIITVYHAMQSRFDGIQTRHRLVSTLWKGSLLYALSLFVISLANIVTFALPVSSGYSGIIDVFQGVLHGIIASRILFDLRDADQSEDYSFYVSDLQYALRPISTTTYNNV